MPAMFCCASQVGEGIEPRISLKKDKISRWVTQRKQQMKDGIDVYESVDWTATGQTWEKTVSTFIVHIIAKA